MAYKTKRPTGISIKRISNAIVIEWKIGDENYGAGQTFQYRYPGQPWQNISISTVKTKTHIVVNSGGMFPYSSKGLGLIYFRIRGRRRAFSKDGKSYSPKVSDWATKEYDILLPNRPTLSAAFSSSENNVTTFSWATNADDESSAWFTAVQKQTCLVQNSTITDGAKIPASLWSTYSAGTAGASGSVTITENSSVINRGISYTRWFRVRACGPQGPSAWSYAKHVYAVPYQVKNVKAEAKNTAAGGYLCTATWKTPLDAAHPIDKINVQYTFSTPTESMGCPDTASWTDAGTLAYHSGNDATAFSIDSTVSADQCLFVRINTIHDRNVTYGPATLAASGKLLAPSGLSVTMDTTTHRATVTATNNSQVPGAFMAVKYMAADDPDGFTIGVIPNGSTSVTVQCPVWSSSSSVKFGVYAVVGSYAATVRGDGVTSYAVTPVIKSDLVTYGGTVPAAPTFVSLAQTNTPGTVRVTFDWAWQEATVAELSWADHNDAWESTDGPSTYIISNTHASVWNISGLETGRTWYIRVRLASGTGENETYGAYSEIMGIDLSSAPTIPILTLSGSVITEDGAITASWSFVSSDGTGQAYAEVAEVTQVEGTTVYVPLASVESAQYVTIGAADAEWSEGETHSIVVRVTSSSGRRSEWSEPVAVTIAEPLTATITTTSLVEQTITVDDVSRTVMSLTEMPLGLTVTGAGEGGVTRVVIERAEDYHMERPDERDYNGFEGETIAIYSQTGEAAITIGNDDLIGHLDDGAKYRIIATVQDGIGQSSEALQEFEVHWSHQALVPAAVVQIDQYYAAAVLKPVAPEGTLETDVCDIYRLSADKPELIYPGATFGEKYVDPYPTIGEHGGHRFVFKTANGDYITENDEIAWTDMTEAEGDVFRSESNIIDFGTGRVLLQYNSDLSMSWKKDFTETKYLGGSIQGDWNPGVSRTGTFATMVIANDLETITAMRRLAAYAGICHVRTKDGSSYAADVQVSESRKQSTAHGLAEFSLSITRVDPEGYDGLTYDEWIESGGSNGN
jgi:hypothetical protein